MIRESLLVFDEQLDDGGVGREDTQTVAAARANSRHHRRNRPIS